MPDIALEVTSLFKNTASASQSISRAYLSSIDFRSYGEVSAWMVKYVTSLEIRDINGLNALLAFDHLDENSVYVDGGRIENPLTRSLVAYSYERYGNSATKGLYSISNLSDDDFIYGSWGDSVSYWMERVLADISIVELFSISDIRFPIHDVNLSTENYTDSVVMIPGRKFYEDSIYGTYGDGVSKRHGSDSLYIDANSLQLGRYSHALNKNAVSMGGHSLSPASFTANIGNIVSGIAGIGLGYENIPSKGVFTFIASTPIASIDEGCVTCGSSPEPVVFTIDVIGNPSSTDVIGMSIPAMSDIILFDLVDVHGNPIDGIITGTVRSTQSTDSVSRLTFTSSSLPQIGVSRGKIVCSDRASNILTDSCIGQFSAKDESAIFRLGDGPSNNLRHNFLSVGSDYVMLDFATGLYNFITLHDYLRVMDTGIFMYNGEPNGNFVTTNNSTYMYFNTNSASTYMSSNGLFSYSSAHGLYMSEYLAISSYSSFIKMDSDGIEIGATSLNMYSNYMYIDSSEKMTIYAGSLAKVSSEGLNISSGEISITSRVSGTSMIFGDVTVSTGVSSILASKVSFTAGNSLEIQSHSVITFTGVGDQDSDHGIRRLFSANPSTSMAHLLTSATGVHRLNYSGFYDLGGQSSDSFISRNILGTRNNRIPTYLGEPATVHNLIISSVGKQENGNDLAWYLGRKTSGSSRIYSLVKNQTLDSRPYAMANGLYSRGWREIAYSDDIGDAGEVKVYSSNLANCSGDGRSNSVFLVKTHPAPLSSISIDPDGTTGYVLIPEDDGSFSIADENALEICSSSFSTNAVFSKIGNTVNYSIWIKVGRLGSELGLALAIPSVPSLAPAENMRGSTCSTLRMDTYLTTSIGLVEWHDSRSKGVSFIFARQDMQPLNSTSALNFGSSTAGGTLWGYIQVSGYYWAANSTPLDGTSI